MDCCCRTTGGLFEGQLKKRNTYMLYVLQESKQVCETERLFITVRQPWAAAKYVMACLVDTT